MGRDTDGLTNSCFSWDLEFTIGTVLFTSKIFSNFWKPVDSGGSSLHEIKIQTRILSAPAELHHSHSSLIIL